MGRITEEMIRKRAEHNEGMVSNLEEVALHQQNIEHIELLGQLCPHLKILYLQNNLISTIQQLHKLKELEYLNLAVNNITKVQNLQRCESLQKLDLTVNFVNKVGLLSLASLQANHNLRELYLIGNPCTDWPGYRQYVVAQLPTLQKLDGQDIKRSERIAAQQVGAQLHAQLRAELQAEGIDPDVAATCQDDSMYDENGEVAETGYRDENGEMKRPWCAATRILEHREMEAQNAAAAERKKASKSDLFDDSSSRDTRHADFPAVKEGEPVMQRNEGKWEFTLDESEDRKSIVLEVAVGKYLDTSLIQADVQPTFVRLLIKGRLLQLLLPAEVKPDSSVAQRSNASGRLVLTMPKENPQQVVVDVACTRSSKARSTAAPLQPANTNSMPRQSAAQTKSQPANMYNIVKRDRAGSDVQAVKEIRKATIAAADVDEDDDYVPSL